MLVALSGQTHNGNKSKELYNKHICLFGRHRKSIGQAKPIKHDPWEEKFIHLNTDIPLSELIVPFSSSMDITSNMGQWRQISISKDIN